MTVPLLSVTGGGRFFTPRKSLPQRHFTRDFSRFPEGGGSGTGGEKGDASVQVVALVGQSGSGKTSCVSLLQRLYDCQVSSGAVR